MKASDDPDLSWYAIYTAARAEKKIYNRLLAKGFEVYLPLQNKLRQWSDRKKWVEMPLIPSYLFVRLCPKQFLNVLQESGVVRFISFEGKPVQVRNEEIDWLKRLLQTDVDIEATSELLQPGDQIEVRIGALAGLRGELLAYKGSQRVVIRLEKLGQSLLISIPSEYLVKVAQ